MRHLIHESDGGSNGECAWSRRGCHAKGRDILRRLRAFDAFDMNASDRQNVEVWNGLPLAITNKLKGAHRRNTCEHPDWYKCWLRFSMQVHDKKKIVDHHTVL